MIGRRTQKMANDVSIKALQEKHKLLVFLFSKGNFSSRLLLMSFQMFRFYNWG